MYAGPMNAADHLRRLGAKRLKLETDLDNVRTDLAAAVRAASHEGMRQVDIVKATGYTREMIRRIQRGDAA